MKSVSGWLNIYKPKGMSSAKLVALVKRLVCAGGISELGKQKIRIGHAGTLDPLAEGVLPIGIGEATKLMQFLVNASKSYVFTIQFGMSTSTGDSEGDVILTTDRVPTEEQCFDVCENFIGTISQKPHAFSAVKVNGKRAYKLARENINFDLASRVIQIYDLKCLSVDSKTKTAQYLVECSKGTYVRKLAEDLALSLQSLGFVIELRRTRVGVFFEADSISL